MSVLGVVRVKAKRVNISSRQLEQHLAFLGLGVILERNQLSWLAAAVMEQGEESR